MELTEGFKANIIETAKVLRGHERRLFMARTAQALGKGGQRRAEAEFGWSRVTIRKGMHELRSGIACCDAVSFRGRARAEEKLPALLDDIRDIAKGFSQTDPQFRNRRLYTKLTGEELRRQLIKQKGYQAGQLPTPRTLRTKLNNLGFHLTKVAKCKPKKRSSRPMRSSRN
jgi:hypothetical protein